MSPKEENQAGQDGILAVLKAARLQPTVKNYLEAAYPQQNVEELMQDAEVMEQVNQALGIEPQ